MKYKFSLDKGHFITGGLMLPKAPELKTKRLSFRADSETCKKLDEIAVAMKMKKSDIIRSWINQTYEELGLNKKK